MGLGDILGSISPLFGMASGDGLFGKMGGGGLGGLGGLLGMLLGGGSKSGGSPQGQSPVQGQQPYAPQANNSMIMQLLGSIGQGNQGRYM